MDDSDQTGKAAAVTVLDRIRSIADRMCTEYCKWPDLWDEEKEGCELSENDICINCPLSELL